MLCRYVRADIVGELEPGLDRVGCSIVDFSPFRITHEVDGLQCPVDVLPDQVGRVVLEIVEVRQEFFRAYQG